MPRYRGLVAAGMGIGIYGLSYACGQYASKFKVGRGFQESNDGIVFRFALQCGPPCVVDNVRPLIED
jgi:hypothetical protein